MANSATLIARPRVVQSTARYAVNDGTRRGFGQAPADIRVVEYHDMRSVATQPSLEAEGFALVKHRSSISNFKDGKLVASVYLDELRDLLRQITGSPHVFMQQNWVVRADPWKFVSEEVAPGKIATSMGTGGFLHIDYDAASAPNLARQAMLAAGVHERPKGRLVGINTWRTFSPPPQDKPLGFLDRRTLRERDLIAQDTVVHTASFVSYQIQHNPEHRFCWWSDMTGDELLLFTGLDEAKGPTSAVAHTAFDDPTCPPGTPGRESIEARAYVFIDE
jgi:hypothetical protein